MIAKASRRILSRSLAIVTTRKSIIPAIAQSQKISYSLGDLHIGEVASSEKVVSPQTPKTLQQIPAPVQYDEMRALISSDNKVNVITPLPIQFG